VAQDAKIEKSSDEDMENTELPPGVMLLHRIKGHAGPIRAVAFDPQGETLASGSDYKTVKLWDGRTGKFLRTLEGHEHAVCSVAFDPQGETLASGSDDKTVRLWETCGGRLLRTFRGHLQAVKSVAFDPRGETLVSGSADRTLRLWEAQSGKLLRTLEGHADSVRSVAFDPTGETLASGSYDNTVKRWDARTGRLLDTLEGHGSLIMSVAFDGQGKILASGSGDQTVKLWEARNGRLLQTLEGHTEIVNAVAFSPDGHLLASKSNDQKIRLWSCETWETLAVITAERDAELWSTGFAFHPILPLLAAAVGKLGAMMIHIWELDLAVLLGTRAAVSAAARSVHHTTGKIVLVGDHSVGKSALGYRLIHGDFKEQAATHGQQFWVFPALGQRRADGTECEAILWDFAGQPDYRLVHALFVDNADLALVLFDASDLRDPLHGVGFWLKQLRAGRSRCSIVLVALRWIVGPPR
jgi:WD40 repeat protein